MEITREIYWNIGHGPATLVPMYLFATVALAVLVFGFVRRLKMYRLGRPLLRTDQPFARFGEMMRTMLLPGLLDNVKRNINHQKTAVKMFEIGKVFTPAGSNVQPIERTMLTGVLSGNRHGESSFFHFKQEPVDIFDAKGGAEFVIREMKLGGVGGDGCRTRDSGLGTRVSGLRLGAQTPTPELT